MQTPAKSSRINRALEVLRLSEDGVSVTNACRMVGIPRSTFYDICKKNSEELQPYLKAKESAQIEQLLLVLGSHTKALEKLIEDGQTKDLKPMQHLAYVKYLDERMYQLMEDLGIKDEPAQEPQNFKLTGPKLIRAVSNRPATESKDPSLENG